MANSRANEYLNGGLFSEPRPRPSLLSITFGHDTVPISDKDIVTDFWRRP